MKTANATSQPRIVLAYSGGLDTSYCVKLLSHDLNYEVHAVLVNTGGFHSDEIANIEERAKSLGVASFTCIDKTKQFYEECVRYLLFGNVLRNQCYPLSVSAERVFQAQAIAAYANRIDAQAIAHGSTGAGNDQIRFDMVFRILCPDRNVITPIRDRQLTREQEVNYLGEHGVDLVWDEAKYSVNKGLWGTSIGGVETLASRYDLPDEAFPTPVTADQAREVVIGFERGEPVALDGRSFSHPVDLIGALQELAGPYGIGRDIHVGDTVIGIKGRVGFEAAAPMTLIKAHHLLEKHTLTKLQLAVKEQVAQTYGDQVHSGLFLDPALRDMETYLASTQRAVTGNVYVRLKSYRLELIGIESAYDLMSSKFGSYGEVNMAWSGDDARGFAKILANQAMIHRLVREEKLI